MKKQPEATAATRQRIIDAFWTLYGDSPAAEIRIKEITLRAGLNRCTFYQYFTDLYDLLRQEEARIIQEIIDRKRALGGDAAVPGMLSGIAELYRTNGRYLCILTGENGDPGFIPLLKERLLAEFMSAQRLPDSLQTSIVFSYGLSGLLSAFRTWFLSEPGLPLETFLRLAEQMVLHGIPAAVPAPGASAAETGERPD